MSNSVLNKKEMKKNITSSNKWLRALAMVVFSFVAYFALFAVYALMILQFLFALITNKINQRLFYFSQSLNTYVRQIYAFLLYEREQKPYPFDKWPSVTEPTITTEKET